MASLVIGLLVVAGLPSPAAATVSSDRLAPGVTYEEFTRTTARGVVHGHLVEVDLRNPFVVVDLLTAGAVAARAPLSTQANERRAIAAVNGDFFNVSNTQPGVPVTGAAVGPAIGGGRDLKAAVPDRQRFGPGLPAGTSTRDVIGVGVDRVGRLATVAFEGKAHTTRGGFAIDGFNQYALPMNGIGVFDSEWGTPSRKRSTCGTDTTREAPCSDNTYELTVRRGKVVQATTEPGEGAIARDTVVLVGREEGADTLRELEPGDRVRVDYDLAPNTYIPFRFAVGGFPVLRDGQPLAGLNATTAAIRSSAGVSQDGRRLYLMALDGASAGLTIAELAQLMRDFGAASAVNLDGGGSSTLVARKVGEPAVAVRNHPSGGVERAIPNGIGVFSRLG
ncbi:phosphodiester glycosidase family protein [Phytohabitans kaempferiae]|uniref:phosphodiester glycosidase family protein n=1 Tax=Phytohabitans kaempferiae TaxID=1620943 RepID=UPI0036720718